MLPLAAGLGGAGRRGARPEHGRRSHVLDRQSAPGGDLFWPGQALQRGHGRVHHVDRVGRTERARQYIVHAGALKYGPNRPARDHAGSRAGRLQQHHAGGVFAGHGVRNRAADPGHLEEGLLGRLDALRDRRWYFLGLAVANADHAVAVADYDEGGDAEPATTLDDLGHPVDGDHALKIGGAFFGRAAAAVVTTIASLATTAAT